MVRIIREAKVACSTSGSLPFLTISRISWKPNNNSSKHSICLIISRNVPVESRHDDDKLHYDKKELSSFIKSQDLLVLDTNLLGREKLRVDS